MHEEENLNNYEFVRAWENEPDNSEKRFFELLKKTGISEDLAADIKEKLKETTELENNIIFIFTEGDYLITAIHVPSEAIGGSDGPVLTRGANNNHIFAAFSKDFIRSKIENLDLPEDIAGLPTNSELMWVQELEDMAEMVKVELSANPPEKWSDGLEGGLL